VRSTTRRKRETGLRERHAASCPSRPTRRRAATASGWDARSSRRSRRRPQRRREDTRGASRKGSMRASQPTTVQQAAETLRAGMEDGTIRNRSGERYKPSTVRGYREALKNYVYSTLEKHKLSAVDRRDVQAIVETMAKAGHDASTIRNAVNPLRDSPPRDPRRSGRGQPVRVPRAPRGPQPARPHGDARAGREAGRRRPGAGERALGNGLLCGLRLGEIRAMK
jgi:hypothetical protein